jgi:flagellar protein FlaG
MEGITQIMKIPEAASREAVKAKTRSPETSAVVPAASENQAAPLASQPVPAENVKHAAAELDKALQQQNSDLSVSVDETSGTMVVRITDSNTGEVVKQIPPKQLMDANVSMNKIVGLLIDDQG